MQAGFQEIVYYPMKVSSLAKILNETLPDLVESKQFRHYVHVHPKDGNRWGRSFISSMLLWACCLSASSLRLTISTFPKQGQ